MKRLVAVIAVFEAFSLALILINIWFLAALNGGSIMLTVTAYGERWAEYLLWLVLTPVLVLGFHYTLEQVRATD
jgi:uncharacterized membrane protein